jgi:hypothetical protein
MSYHVMSRTLLSSLPYPSYHHSDLISHAFSPYPYIPYSSMPLSLPLCVCVTSHQRSAMKALWRLLRCPSQSTREESSAVMTLRTRCSSGECVTTCSAFSRCLTHYVPLLPSSFYSYLLSAMQMSLSVFVFAYFLLYSLFSSILLFFQQVTSSYLSLSFPVSHHLPTNSPSSYLRSPFTLVHHLSPPLLLLHHPSTYFPSPSP